MLTFPWTSAARDQNQPTMRTDPQYDKQRPSGPLPSRFGALASGPGRFVKRGAKKTLWTGDGDDMKTNPVPAKSISPTAGGRIPRPVRSLSSLVGNRADDPVSPGSLPAASRIPRTRITPSEQERYERTPSVASSTESVRSESRIPRLSLAHSQIPKNRGSRGITLADAFRMTADEEEELGRSSPSPAPRSVRQRRSEGELRLLGLTGQSPLHAKRPNGPRRTSVNLHEDSGLTCSVGRTSIPRPIRLSDDDDDLDRKIHQFERDQQRKQGALERGPGLFSRTNVGERVAETGHELAKKASNNSLKENSPARPRTWGSKGKATSDWMKRALVSPDKLPLQERNKSSGTSKEILSYDKPIPSVEVHAPSTAPSSEPELVKLSPQRSFAWKLDADFTEGDIQISNSPRVTFQRDPPDSQRTLSAVNQPQAPCEGSGTEKGSHFLSKRERSTDESPRRTNTRLDEIRHLEALAESKISQRAARGNRPRDNSSTRLEEVRDREADSLSRKTLASVRLDEIRERNSLSRSNSPEVLKMPSRQPTQEQRQPSQQQHLQQPTPDPSEDRRSESIAEPRGSPTTDMPVTVYQTKTALLGTDYGDSDSMRPVQRHHPEDSHDLLRCLSRVAGKSPQPEVQESDDKPGICSISTEAETTKPSIVGRTHKGEHFKPGGNDKKANQKPSVGFVGLSRSSSVESIKSKRSTRSDIDPTARIEAEKNLFALQDNYSEKGSRAASDIIDTEDEDHFESLGNTPRPERRQDPLTNSTPRAPGAYVETPATVKVYAPPENGPEPVHVSEPEPEPEPEPDTLAPAAGPSSQWQSTTRKPAADMIISESKPLPRAHAASRAIHFKHNSTSSVSPRRRRSSLLARSVGGRTIQMNGGKITVRHRRGRSEPRRPLVNTASMPSVREDLLKIKRAANIEDSTVDDFDELIRKHERIAEEFRKGEHSDKEDSDARGHLTSGGEPSLVEGAQNADARSGTGSGGESRSMGRRLNKALAEIKSAKAWADKLEDRIANHHHMPWQRTCKYCDMSGSGSAVAFSIKGWFSLILLVLTAWLVLETVMCYFFCRPTTCGPGISCEWNPSDPSFGVALPRKLDEWALGGRGLRLASEMGQRVGDFALDVWCVAFDGDSDSASDPARDGAIFLGPAGCRYKGKYKKHVARILTRCKQASSPAGYWEEMSGEMHHWLQDKRKESGMDHEASTSAVSEEEEDEDLEEDIGFISSDEML